MAVDNRMAAGIFLIILMVLAFSPLNTEVQAAASAESATAIETTIGMLFPYIWFFMVLMIIVVMIYDVLKE